MSTFHISTFNPAEQQAQLIALWQECFSYGTPHNDPALTIEKKLAVDDLLWVALQDGTVVGSIMAGYDGHRGWIYSLAVTAKQRKTGLGTALLEHAEKELTQLGCLKINLQVMPGNDEVIAYYEKRGYRTEPRTSMGKMVIENIPGGADCPAYFPDKTLEC